MLHQSYNLNFKLKGIGSALETIYLHFFARVNVHTRTIKFDSAPLKTKQNDLCGPVGVWAGIKPFAQKKQVEELLRTSKKCSQGLSPITGKAEHVLLSIVLL